MLKRFSIFIFCVAVSSIISALTVLPNVTSAAVTLTFFVNSTGGSSSFVYSVWCLENGGNFSGSVLNVPLILTAETKHFVHVQDLLPSKTLTFTLNVHANEDGWQSENITAIGRTGRKLIILIITLIIILIIVI